MIDTHPCATPMPSQPVATVTSTEARFPEAPFPPPSPLPVFEPPSVTDPVSNLDFLPVDDAFALEMRSETIEQLVGGDALRRGESERIEAGRSHTNADLVAGRHRVRVHGSLHEHTGHGFAEQAAHLHTTVDSRLDVHAGSEDTVLLAGHMSDLWDGSTAIVAAMTDDTVAGGGIRVTTPLDLWVHGLMGMEERIGTCTADAVLMELGATHYEREYGPGVHAAGLAVYTGSLYQSNRSSFRPLMRVSSGVRNLIAGGDGAGGGGDGGAGSAPGASSPPPVPGQTGAAAESASGTLAAGRRAVEAPTTAFGTTDALTDARRVPLEELVDSFDARAAEEMGETRIVMRADDLPQLTRCADTAEQLGALQETLRIDGTEAGSEVAGGFRASEFQGAVSMHPAGGGGGPLEIDPPSAVYGKNAPIVRSHPDVPWGQGPEMKLQLLGGADHPPQSAAPESDFPAIIRRLNELHSHYDRHFRTDIVFDYHQVIHHFSEEIIHRFKEFVGNTEKLANRPRGVAIAEPAYLALQEAALQAEREDDLRRAATIRVALRAIDKQAGEALQSLITIHGIPEAPSTQATRTMQAIQAMQRPPATAVPPVTVTPTTVAPHGRLGVPGPVRRQRTGHDGYRGHPYGRLGIPGPVRPIVGLFDPAFAGPPVTVAPTTMAPPGRLDFPGPAHPFVVAVRPVSSEPAGGLVHAMDVPGPAPASSHPGPSLSEATGAKAGDPGRGRLDPPATVSGTTAAHPAATGTIVTPSRAGSSAFWLQPADPMLAPGSAPLDTGLHHAGETVQPPPVTTTASSAAPAPVPPLPPPSTLVNRFDIERALIAGEFPPGFVTPGRIRVGRMVDNYLTALARHRGDAARLAADGRGFADFSLAEQITAGRVPFRTIDMLVEWFRATDNRGRNVQTIEFLLAQKNLLQIDLQAEYPGRVHPLWLDHVQMLLRLSGEPVPPSTASATGLARFEVPRIDPPLRTSEGVSHAAPPPPAPAPAPPPAPAPAPAPGRTGADTVAPPTAADPLRIRPQGMGGEPHPVAFDPWSAPPGPSSQVASNETKRHWKISFGALPESLDDETLDFAGAPPGPSSQVDFDPWSAPPGPSSQVASTETKRHWKISFGAPPESLDNETLDFAGADSGATRIPLSQRKAIARQLGNEAALFEAQYALLGGGAEALGWSTERGREVLDDVDWLNYMVKSKSVAVAAMTDVDWDALEALARILDEPLASP